LRFLADENVPSRIVSHLVETGHDVVDVKELNASRISDNEVVNLAKKQERALITFDKHFANILQYPPRETCGIIVVRIHPSIWEDVTKALDRFFKESNFDDLKGKLVVLTKKGYRISLK